MSPRRFGNYIHCLLVLIIAFALQGQRAGAKERHFLYVASPGIRNYVQYGGVGVLVFDADDGYKFVRRIPTWNYPAGKDPANVKGIAASAKTGKLYVSNFDRIIALDLVTDKIVWDKAYQGGCDRLAISPDGKILYVPSFEGAFWNVLNAATGDIITKIEPKSGAHNTVYSPDGAHAYLGGLRSPLLSVTDTNTHTIEMTIGPFAAGIRPFTINGSQTLCFVNVNGLLGFEVGDLKTGKKLYRVEVEGYKQGPVKRHGCPSHGIAMTPDEKELWVCDGANARLHIFDATVMPPKLMSSIPVREMPGWITFSIDGRYVYPSTGEIIDARTKQTITTLKDETGREVQSEKILEIVFDNKKPVRAGDQFGKGAKR